MGQLAWIKALAAAALSLVAPKHCNRQVDTVGHCSEQPHINLVQLCSMVVVSF